MRIVGLIEKKEPNVEKVIEEPVEQKSAEPVEEMTEPTPVKKPRSRAKK